MKKRLLSALLALCMVLALMPGTAGAVDTLPITKTNIRADGVFNNKGYGSIYTNGEFDEDAGDYAVFPQAAVVDRNGNFVFPYKDSFSNYYFSDGIFSLTEESPYIISDNYSTEDRPLTYYKEDGSPAFSFESSEREYIKDGMNYAENTQYWGGPMQNGVAVIIKRVMTHSWTGVAGSVSYDYYTYLVDASGAVICTLPDDFNQEISYSGSDYEDWFTMKSSLAWYSEGLIAWGENVSDDDWNITHTAKGYLDRQGNTVIDLSGRAFTNSYPFYDGLAAVVDQNDLTGFINKSGELVIPCMYEGTSGFSEGVASVKKDGKYGYINKENEVVIPFAYDNAYKMFNGVAAVVKDGKCGLIDSGNNVVVPFEYDDISEFEGGTAYAVKDGYLYIIGETTYKGEAGSSYAHVPAVTGGTVVLSKRNAEPGDWVNIYVTPDKGYKLESLTVTDLRGWPVTVREMGENAFSFTMPNARVNVNPVFVKVEEENDPYSTAVPNIEGSSPNYGNVVLNPTAMNYSDVSAADWFYEAVRFCHQRYLMNKTGEAEGKFEPNAPATRAAVWTALSRAAGRNTITQGDNWYDRAQIWAKGKGITDGEDPMGTITREQLVTMLWRYNGNKYVQADNLSRFNDSASVSWWAAEAVNWAVAAGIINGANGGLNPQGSATRAEVASILSRFCQFAG